MGCVPGVALRGVGPQRAGRWRGKASELGELSLESRVGLSADRGGWRSCPGV